MEMTTGGVDADGARLHYRVRGTGPVLLVLQGGDGDAEHSDALVEYLVDSFTVVTYDRRGLARSPTTDPRERVSLARHSADAHRLLTTVARQPAIVVGCSIGAIIGLELVTQHPEAVRLLLAHEPPVYRLLTGVARDDAMRVAEDIVRSADSCGVMSDTICVCQ